MVAALEQQHLDGTCFANPTEKEIDLATLICGRVPGMQRIRFCNTGTEAVMFAIKAAQIRRHAASLAAIVRDPMPQAGQA